MATDASLSEEAPSEVKTRGKKTRIKFEDLPTTFSLSDGTAAKPLDEWHSSEAPPLEAEPTRKRRSRKPKDTSETAEEALGSSLPEEKVKRTRKRGPKAAEVGDFENIYAVVEVTPETYPRTGLARQILDNLEKFPHCLLLTRVGQFYESYFHQAEEIARLLNIKFTSRRWGGRDIGMCGFPIMHLDKYLKVLVQQNKRFVAMCEEFPRYSGLGVKEFERRVTRVITPGTLIDESFLNQYENNYLLAVGAPGKGEELGLAWIDVSTGEFFSKASSYATLRDDITRIGPREVVLDKQFENQPNSKLFEILSEDKTFISFGSLAATPEESSGGDFQQLASNASEALISDELTKLEGSAALDLYTPEESIAINLLTSYLRSNLLENMPPLHLPNREDANERMQIDTHTITALEIRENLIEGGARGSLLSVIKRTITSSGTRLLARWLCSPSTSLSEINARQFLVAFFCARPHLRADLFSLLSEADDAGRLVQKFLLGRGDSSHLLSLNNTIKSWTNIQSRITEEREVESSQASGFDASQWSSLDALMNRMADLQTLSQRISMSILSYEESDAEIEDSENPPSSSEALQQSGNRLGTPKLRINPQFSEKLQTANAELEDLLKDKATLERYLQNEFSAPSLTLRSSPGQGFHVHLANSRRHQSLLNADSRFVAISESNTTKSYFFQEWTLLGYKIFEASMTLAAAEREAFEILRNEVNGHAGVLRRNARILDELDVTLAFSNLADEMDFVRPVLCEEPVYDVQEGRHPTVELGLLTSGRVFTANSLHMNPESRLHIVTGPNMGGKSTLLRQTALTAILAQTGSFVPASSARIGIVDKLFSRVGAKDDLFHDRSTFMVEMLETAQILSRATPRSLVIMDEVGRGTTVTDGLAIAFATVHHLVTKNNSRTLFATHFHELADLLGCSDSDKGHGLFDTVSFFCTDIDETDDDHFSYSYRVRPGVNRNSHGLKVAQLAGMPPLAVQVAEDAMSFLREQPLSTLSPEQLRTLGQSIASQ